MSKVEVEGSRGDGETSTNVFLNAINPAQNERQREAETKKKENAKGRGIYKDAEDSGGNSKPTCFCLS